jgi:hypothetical protein
VCPVAASDSLVNQRAVDGLSKQRPYTGRARIGDRQEDEKTRSSRIALQRDGDE